MEIQVIVADLEGALLISTHRLEIVTSKYDLKISTSKMKMKCPMKLQIQIGNGLWWYASLLIDL